MFWRITSAVLAIITIIAIFLLVHFVRAAINFTIIKSGEMFQQKTVERIEKGHLIISYIFDAPEYQKVYDFSLFEKYRILGITIYDKTPKEDESILDTIIFDKPVLLTDVYIIFEKGGDITWVLQ